MDFKLLILGCFVFCLLPKSYAENSSTLEFSSLGQVPQSLLNSLQNPKGKNSNGGSNSGSGDGSNNQNTETYTFTDFSQIPQSVLDELTSSEVEHLKSELSKSRSGSEELDFKIGSPGTPQKSTTPGDTNTPKTETYTFTDFSEIPQSVLDELTSSEIDHLKSELANSRSGSQELYFETGDSSTPKSAGGSNTPKTETYTFTDFSQIPQSVLDELSSSEIAHLKSELTNSRSGSKEIYFETGDSSTSKSAGGSNSPRTETLTFTDFSQIPESVLEELSSSEIEHLKSELAKSTSGSEEIEFETSDTSNQHNKNGRYEITSINQIPESIYKELTSSEIEDLKYELSHRKNGPQRVTYQISIGGKPQENKKPDNIYYIKFGDEKSSQKDSESISTIYEIPESIRKTIPRYEIREIKRTLDNYKEIPHHWDISKYSKKQFDNLLTVIIRYVDAGGKLTGIPPVDLLLLRIFLNDDSNKLCSSPRS